MIPVATSSEVRAADEMALGQVSHETLVARAGTHVARAASQMIAPVYGRRVVVVAGKGSNGADGRVAAALLAKRGALVRVVDAADDLHEISGCDLVIDAAYGTGFHGTYNAPSLVGDPLVGDPLVVAVDIPSGVSADTGEVSGRPMMANKTVTFAALKPGLLMGEGKTFAGSIDVADIGVVVDDARAALVEDSDVENGLPRRDESGHKWKTAVAVIAGSPLMRGAPVLCATGALRAGAGMVLTGTPGESYSTNASAPPPCSSPREAVHVELSGVEWAAQALEQIDRCKALVIGPGIGRSPESRSQILEVIERAPVPVVVDADALAAFDGVDALRRGAMSRSHETVLTPHDGEYAALAKRAPGADRIAAASTIARACAATVLLKGSLTTIAYVPSGRGSGGALDEGTPVRVLLVNSGSSKLATAGTGDVLSGMIAAFIARGLEPFIAAAFAAHVHGRAASIGPGEGLVAGDLPGLASRWLSGERPRRGS